VKRNKHKDSWKPEPYASRMEPEHTTTDQTAVFDRPKLEELLRVTAPKEKGEQPD